MSINDLDTKVTTLRELQADIERLTAEAEAVKDELKAEMIERGSDVLVGTGWKASWKVVESSRLDTKALKAQMPDVYGRFTVTSKTSRFCLN